MAKVKAASQGLGLTSSLLTAADKVVGKELITSVVEFAESYRGLDIRLYPAQKVILKMIWGEELSNDLSENALEIPDMFNEHVLHTLTEVEWVDFLYEEERCNFNCAMYNERRLSGKKFGEVVLPVGRRGSKTVLMVASSGFLMYKLYEEIETDFFKYFGLIKTNPLYITFVSNNKNNSSKPFQMLRVFLTGSDFLSKYIYSDSSDRVILLSPVGYQMMQDGTYVDGEYQLIITHAVPSGQVRGDTNIFVSLDEFCFLRDSNSTSKTKYLDEELYDALVPSTTTLLDPVTRQSWGLAAILSSVNGKSNQMYKLYASSFGDSNKLMFHLPSFYLNRNFAPDTLKSKYRSSKTIYNVEIMSVFDVTLNSWLSEDWHDFQACIHEGRKSRPSGVNGLTYFAGIDFGFVFDSTTIAIGHTQQGSTPGFLPKNVEAYNSCVPEAEVVVLDALIVLSPEKDKPLDPFAVVDIIFELLKFFNIKRAIYDQFSKTTIEAMLDRKGLIRSGRFVAQNATQVVNDQLAVMTKEAILSHRLELIDSPNLETEFAGLIETVKSGFVKIENSNPNVHDDSYSAISRLVYLCLTEGARDATPINMSMISVKEASMNSTNNSSTRDKALGSKAGMTVKFRNSRSIGRRSGGR